MEHMVVFCKSARKGLLATVFMLAASLAHARNSENLSFDAAIGLPSVEITNPDGTTAGYGGLSFEGRFLMPLINHDSLSVSGVAVGRYFDLENEYSNSAQSEIAKHIGPGLGLFININKIYLGYEYMMMSATHYYIGDFAYKKEFDYTSTNTYIGIDFPMGTMSFGLSYSMSSGTFDKNETGLSRDSDYNEQTLWIHIRYLSDSNLKKIASKWVQ